MRFPGGGVRLFEGVGEAAVAAGDLAGGGFSGDFSSTPGDERVLEDRAANSKTNEAGYAGCHSEPLVNFFLIFAPAKDNAAHAAAPGPPGSSNDLLAILAGIEAFDFPDIRLDARVLELLNGLYHQMRTQLRIVGLLVAIEVGKLLLFGRDQELEHEPALAFVMEIFGKAPQVRRLPLIQRFIAFRIVTDQDLAKGWPEGFDMLGEIFAILEFEFLLPGFLGRAGPHVAPGGRIPQYRRPELLVHEDRSPVLCHAATGHRCEKTFIDDLFGAGYFRSLPGAKRTMPAEHFALE
jgi:hypothetical protein